MKHLKKYGLRNNYDYGSKMLNEHDLGSKSVAKQMFLDMPLKDRKDFVKQCIYEWGTDKRTHIFFFNILLGYTK